MKPNVSLIQDHPDSRLIVLAILDDEPEVVELADGHSTLSRMKELPAVAAIVRCLPARG